MLQTFGSLIIQAYPYSTQDMLSIIAEKGQDSDDIFKIIPENSHWSLRNKIDSEQYINWNQESVIIIASVLMVRKVCHQQH